MHVSGTLPGFRVQPVGRKDWRIVRIDFVAGPRYQTEGSRLISRALFLSLDILHYNYDIMIICSVSEVSYESIERYFI